MKRITLCLILFGLAGMLRSDTAPTCCTELGSRTWEGDVVPLAYPGFPGGDGVVNFLDVQRILWCALGLQAPLNACEFEITDAAPRIHLGDGRVTASDVIQAFRYNLGWDPVVLSGGPTSPFESPLQPGLGKRSLRLQASPLVRARDNVVNVMLERAGDEHAVAFGLSFDPSKLKLKGITNFQSSGSPEIPATSVIVNAFQATNGLVTVVAMSDFANLSAGTGKLLQLKFEVLDYTGPTATISFTNLPTVCEMCSTNADPLVATFESATFELTGTAPSLTASQYTDQGLALVLNGEADQTYTIQTSTNLLEWTTLFNFTNSAPVPPLADTNASQFSRRFYRAIPMVTP